MGKKNRKTGNSEVDKIIKNLAEEQKKLERKLKEIHIDCHHQKKNGMFKGEFKGLDFKCDRCTREFSFENISMNQLTDAANVLINAINQMKAMTENPEEEMDTIHKLGILDFNITEFVEMYRRATKEENFKNFKKKKKGKNNERYSYGGYGSTSFIGGGKKKNKNNCW